jgi:drug/metabolite transporter (DMT)-like permease
MSQMQEARGMERRNGDDEHPPRGATQHPVRAVLLVVVAVFLFACMDTTTKYLTATYEVPVVMAMRYIVHCLLMLLLLAPTQGRQLVQTRRTGLVLVRAGCLAAASLFMGLALQRMPVAEATAIVFLAPLLVVLVAGSVLREKVGAAGFAAAAAGFVGVLLIARPGSGLDAAGVGFAVCAACVIAAYQVLSRLLASTERTLALLFYAALLGSILYGALLPWFWEGRTPTPLQAGLFVSMGVTGGLGHFLFTAAHRIAPASMLAPMMYMQLFWAVLLGWWVFGHVSGALSILGMVIVAGSGVVVALRSHLARRALAVAAAD